MKKFKSKIIGIFLISTIVILATLNCAIAKENEQLNVEAVEYSKEYKEWLELPEEEKAKTLQPSMYNIVSNQTFSQYLKNRKNILKINTMLKATSSNKFDLREFINNNLKVKDQKSTNSCWTFASLSALETNLAFNDYKNSGDEVVYDFSERHMDYSTARSAFLNNQINEKGFNRILSAGGNMFIAQNYLTNGDGAIPETEMQFEDNQSNIDINKIKNKTISTTVYDTVEFENPGTVATAIEETKAKMKEHINNYGGIFAGIHTPEIGSTVYNNTTGALYCNNDDTYKQDHAVTIIGWDDRYSVDNFNDGMKPTTSGAWIAKNSYGEEQTITMSEAKSAVFEAYREYCIEQEWDSASEIPESVIINVLELSGYVNNDDGTFSLKIGDNGFIYISYEDVNVYKQLWGIKKAKATKDYKNIYQNDVLGPSKYISVTSTSDKIYIANVFTRDSSIEEAVDKISVYTPQEFECKVYINPNSNSKKQEDLQNVELAGGETANVEVGYHTIEFAEPINLTGNSFVVVLEIENTELTYVALESKTEGGLGWENAEINANESFFSIDENTWYDLATNEEAKGNTTIKAFTTTVVEEPVIDATNIFENAKATVTNLEARTYTDPSKESYVKMKIKVSNIKKGDENNKYYYNISGTQNAGETEDRWIEIPFDNIKEDSDGTYFVELEVDTRELENIEELTEAEELYLNFKQIDKNNKETFDTIKLEISDNAIFYIDDNEIGNAETVVNKIIDEITKSVSSSAAQSSKDTTMANTILPNAGNVPLIIIVTAVIFVIGGLVYHRYRNIDK